jgi:hypothetical protein
MSECFNKKQTREAWTKFLERRFSKESFTSAYFITLITRTDRRDTALNTFRHFFNKLNRKAYGNNWKQNGNYVKSYPVMEKNSSGYYHFHLTMFVDTEESSLKLKNDFEVRPLVEAVWTNMKGACRSTCTSPNWCRDIDRACDTFHKVARYVTKNFANEMYGEPLLEYM